jgi:prepilin-type processing-associated H-X9-DG protein
MPQMETPADPAGGTPQKNLAMKKRYLESITDKDDPNAYRNGAAEIELAADATISDQPDRNASFTNVRGGWPQAHWSNHFKKTKAIGGNVLFLDGHVTWRDFKEMNCWVRLGGSNQWF